MDDKARGEALAQEILSTFDSAVDEARVLLDPKPPPAEAVPRLAPLLATYGEKMTALNAKYRALAKDPPAFGAVNRWLGDNRGKAVFRKDSLLGALVFHYRYNQSSPEIVEFVNAGLVRLLDAAVTR